MRLVDHLGNELPTKAEREYAENQLKEFLEKHKQKCMDWIREKGMVAFPVHYRLDKKQWVWIGDE